MGFYFSVSKQEPQQGAAIFVRAEAATRCVPGSSSGFDSSGSVSAVHHMQITKVALHGKIFMFSVPFLQQLKRKYNKG
jgi:hypothetical protein